MERMSFKIPRVYTDGSCLKNPGGPSGWSFCLPDDDNIWVVSGGVSSSTNNRMELMAVIEALKWVTGPEYEIYTDSLLTLKCAQGIWKRKANLDLWEEYETTSKGKLLHWNWVKGHSGDEFNEIVDKAARAEAKFQKNKNLAQ
jgi:ribonuclease HI